LSNACFQRYGIESLPSFDRESRWRAHTREGNLLDRSQYPGARALRGETVVPGIDFIFMPPERDELWMRVSAAPFRLVGQAIVGGVTVIQDVDREKRAEEALRQSEESFRQLSDLVPVITWFGGSDGKVRHLNNRWYEYSGQTREEALKNGGLEVVHPDDLDSNLAAWKEAQRVGHIYEHELRLRRHDGAYRWHLVRSHPLQEKQDHITGWFGTSTDIHDLKMAEEACRESEKRFRQFADYSSHVLWILNLDTSQREYLSPAFVKVWGEPPDGMMRDNNRWSETIHPEDRQRAGLAMDRALCGEVVVHEYRIVRADGRVRWIRDTAFPIRSKDGRLQRVGGIAQDTTNHPSSQVYIVDANEISRRALSILVQSAGYAVQTFSSAAAFLKVAPVLQVGCVVLDIGMPEANGLLIPKELKARQIDLPIIVTGQSNRDIRLPVQAMKAGAVDWLETPYEGDALIASIADAMANIHRFSEHEAAADLSRTRIAEMTPRERQVLELLLSGGTNKTIAIELGLSPRTVEIHRARVMERLGVRTLPEAVLMAADAGLRPPPSGRKD
jgi:PAS domain S-box-containing protein